MYATGLKNITFLWVKNFNKKDLKNFQLTFWIVILKFFIFSSFYRAPRGSKLIISSFLPEEEHGTLHLYISRTNEKAIEKLSVQVNAHRILDEYLILS